MKDIFKVYKYEIEEICAINRYMQESIGSFHTESERHAAYPEQSTAHFEDVANITFDSASVIPQGTLNSN